MHELQQINNAVLRYFEAVDQRNWKQAEQLMREEILLDYSSFGGGPAAQLKALDVLSAWRQLLPGFDHTHHQLGPLAIEVQGDGAKVKSNVTAQHFIEGADGGELQSIYGSYEITLLKQESWQISSLRFSFKFQTGNKGLPELAQSRVV